MGSGLRLWNLGESLIRARSHLRIFATKCADVGGGWPGSAGHDIGAMVML